MHNKYAWGSNINLNIYLWSSGRNCNFLIYFNYCFGKWVKGIQSQEFTHGIVFVLCWALYSAVFAVWTWHEYLIQHTEGKGRFSFVGYIPAYVPIPKYRHVLLKQYFNVAAALLLIIQPCSCFFYINKWSHLYSSLWFLASQSEISHCVIRTPQRGWPNSSIRHER